MSPAQYWKFLSFIHTFARIPLVLFSNDSTVLILELDLFTYVFVLIIRTAALGFTPAIRFAYIILKQRCA